MRFTSSDGQAGMTLGEMAAQAVTSGECELIKFAFSCIGFMVHPRALWLYVGQVTPAEADAYIPTAKG